jgi:pimeloyl-ACP methyl ester carboxylesterase
MTKNGDTTIWYDVIGGGPPVVMVYGIGGNSRGWWDEFPRLLSERYTLVMLDNRGTGRSDQPESPWGMPEMTGDVQAVVDAAGLDTFHLLGCSLGTIITRQYVRERGGGNLRSLSLLCPPNGIQATQEDMNAALWWDRTKAPLRTRAKSWPIIHPEEWIGNEFELTARFEAGLLEPTPPRTFKFQMEAAQSAPDPNPALNEYSWPVLIAHGPLTGWCHPRMRARSRQRCRVPGWRCSKGTATTSGRTTPSGQPASSSTSSMLPRRRGEMSGLSIVAIPGLPEIVPGADLAAAAFDATAAAGTPLENGDVLVVTSKIVSKAEGRIVKLETVHVTQFARQYAERWEKEPAIVELVLQEAKRVVRQVGPILITETRHGFICANSGVDQSSSGARAGGAPAARSRRLGARHPPVAQGPGR